MVRASLGRAWLRAAPFTAPGFPILLPTRLGATLGSVTRRRPLRRTTFAAGAIGLGLRGPSITGRSTAGLEVVAVIAARWAKVQIARAGKRRTLWTEILTAFSLWRLWTTLRRNETTALIIPWSGAFKAWALRGLRSHAA